MRKTTKKKIAPIVTAVLAILFIAPWMFLLLKLMGLLDATAGAAVMFPLLCWLIVGGAVIVGVIRALLQRLDEIDGGEEDEASRY